MIREHDCVVLIKDISPEGLQAGDVGTVVHIHKDASAYVVTGGRMLVFAAVGMSNHAS
jgi:hypothetical protein